MLNRIMISLVVYVLMGLAYAKWLHGFLVGTITTYRDVKKAEELKVDAVEMYSAGIVASLANYRPIDVVERGIGELLLWPRGYVSITMDVIEDINKDSFAKMEQLTSKD